MKDSLRDHREEMLNTFRNKVNKFINKVVEIFNIFLKKEPIELPFKNKSVSLKDLREKVMKFFPYELFK